MRMYYIFWVFYQVSTNPECQELQLIGSEPTMAPALYQYLRVATLQADAHLLSPDSRRQPKSLKME